MRAVRIYSLSKKHMATMGILFLFTIILYFATHTLAERKTVSVTANDGTYMGYVYDFEAFGQTLSTKRFLGIPYAKPPVGDLRFSKPKKRTAFTEPYDATEWAPSCLQLLVGAGGDRKPGAMEALKKLAEDCLFLNIFIPNSDFKSNEKLPVMIYFHGGGFNVGSPRMFVPDLFSAYGNVVVVTVAYRLSLWGFLSTGDGNLPGNYGLWDQSMAVEWVHENIAAFNGNPEAITVSGQSAGSASAVYQAMFPGNMGKIRRVIPMSGTPTCPWAFNNNPLKTARRLARLVDCNTDVSTRELAQCLKSKSTQELNRALNTKENGFIEFPMEFVSNVDGEFVPEHPHLLLHGPSEVSKQYRKALANVDFMSGITSEEGLMMLYTFVGVEDADTFEAGRSRFENELVPEITRIVFGEKAPEVINRLIIAEYTNWTDPDNEFNSLKSYVTASGDYVFNIQTLEAASVHAEVSENNNYLYLYDVFPSTHIVPTPFWNKKPQHGDEVTTMFGYENKEGYTSFTTPYIEEPYEWETEFSKAHIVMWANFAKSGNPNEPVDVIPYINTTWPQYDTQSQHYLHMSRQMSDESVGSRLCARATNFWWNVLPRVYDEVKNGRLVSSAAKGDFCKRDGECEP